MGVYDVWQGETPVFDVARVPTTASPGESLSETTPTPGVSTRTIVARNLFDPDRGAKVVAPPVPEKVPEEPDQGIDGVLLLGTVIAGSERYAIMKVPPDLGPVSKKGQRGPRVRAKPGKPPTSGVGVRRVRIGDSLRGYRVQDIEEQKVVLQRGSAQTEVRIDYTREVIAPPKAKSKSKVSAKKSRRTPRSRNSRKRTPKSRGKR